MTRRIVSFLLIFTLLSGIAVFASADTGTVMKELWISADGSDSGNGSASSPFRSIERAKEEVRKYNQNMTGDIIVHVGEGTYFPEDELRFRPEDSGSNGYDVIWRGVRSNPPTISGGRPVNSKWTKGENGIWSAYVPEAEFILDLFVNEKTAIPARGYNVVYGTENYHPEGSRWKNSDGFYADKASIGLYTNPEDIRLHWTKVWRDFHLHIKDIIQDPLNEEQVIVKMDDYLWDMLCGVTANSDERPHYLLGFFVENVYELLDEPGEFYFDKKTKMLSYLPREGEDMNSASVIYGYHDTVLRVEGRDHTQHTSHIRFEDLRFAHCTYSLMNTDHILNQQGEVPVYPTLKGQTSLANINVEYSDNIDFESCVFFGMNSAALVFAEGVFDSNVTGCVFTDIGSAAFVLGRWYISDKDATAPAADRPANVIYRKGWTSSMSVADSYSDTLYMINSSLHDEFAPANSNMDVWRAPADGDNLTWIKFDLDDEYSLESIEVSFEDSTTEATYMDSQDGATEEERSNFEILVSNDKNFEEYEIIECFDSPAPKVVKTKGTAGKKYRYIMLRKTVPGPFCVTGVAAYSWDRAPLSKGAEAGVKNITFENNYLERIGMIHTQAPAIIAHFPNSSSVSHNEIRKTGYTGMDFGWGFGQGTHTLLGNNKINHNRIEDVMMQGHDGGPIYTLGWQPNTEYVGNVLSDSYHMYAGFYMDHTSSMFTIKDTVIYNVPSALEHYNTAEGMVPRSENFEAKKGDAIKVINMYTDNPTIHRTSGEPYIDMEPFKDFSNTDMPDDVARIIGEAGVEEEWQYIYDRVPNQDYWATWGPDVLEASSHYRMRYMSTTARAEGYEKTAEHLLETGNFGNLPWQYDKELYFELEQTLNDFRAGTGKTGRSTASVIEEWDLAMLVRDIYDNPYHLDIDEMLELCDTAIESAVVGKNIENCSKKSLDTFKKSVEEAKRLPTGTMGEKAIVVNRLEKAYQKFYDETYNADIVGCWLPQGESVIDKENKTVTLTVPSNINLRESQPKFAVSENAVLSEDVSKLNYNKKENTISVYNKDARKYSKWKLIIKRESEEKAENVSVASCDWTTSNPNTDLPSYDGKLTLQPYYDASMMKTAISGNLSFRTQVIDEDKTNGIHYIFCAQTSNLEHDGAMDKNTYYELVLKGYTAYLNRVDAGVVTEMAKLDNVGFGYGNFNDISISIEGREENDIIKIDLNGETIFNHLTLNPIKPQGFFGVYSRFQKVVISK